MENPIYVFRNELNKLAEENLIEVDENKKFNSVIELANYLGASIDFKNNSSVAPSTKSPTSALKNETASNSF